MADCLFDQEGNRKYLTEGERAAFRKAAEEEAGDLRTFCLLLHYSGCRISEALTVTSAWVDLAAPTLTFESLKKRKKGIFRAVPLPPEFVDMLDLVPRHPQDAEEAGPKDAKLWGFSHATAWRIIKRVMRWAEIILDSAASPKALRHSFGVNAVLKAFPSTNPAM